MWLFTFFEILALFIVWETNRFYIYYRCHSVYQRVTQHILDILLTVLFLDRLGYLEAVQEAGDLLWGILVYGDDETVWVSRKLMTVRCTDV